MRFFSLFWVEAGRLVRSREAWLLAGLTALAPLAGYTAFFRFAIGDSMATLFLADPMLAGGLAGCLLFALLMLLSLEKPRRSGTDAVTDAVCSPVAMHAARLFAVLTLALLTALLVGLAYLPYTIWKLDIVFSISDYWKSVLLFFLSGPVMGSLLGAALGQLVGRLDVSLVAVAAALVLSRSKWCADRFLWQWSVPLAPALSDAFGSAIVWRTALYSRLMWLCILGGFWLLTLLCVRQYGKGPLGSFLQHARRAALPAIALVLVACGGLLWQVQPFVDHSAADWATYVSADRWNENLTLLKTDLSASIESYALGTMSGTGVYQLQNSSGQAQDLYFKLNPGYSVRSVTANGKAVEWEDLENDFIASREIRCTLPADADILLEIQYGGSPRIWNAQEGQLSGSFISTQGMELSSQHLSPRLAGCVQIDEDAPAEMRIRLRSNLTPVSTGSTRKVSENGDGTNDWLLTNTGTDSFRLFAGDYVCVNLEGGEMPIEFYYSRKYQERLDGMGAIDIMEDVVAYCTEHYGPRSFTQGEPFKIVQLTVFEFGGFASGNISGMGEVFFSDHNLSDADKGAASAEVLAHEIIHQWWGLGASLSDMTDPYWSDEGITTYTTYRLMCELMGEDYAYENYVKKWEEAVQGNAQSFYRRNPEYISLLPERYANDITASDRSVNWYDGNALMIYRAAEILGEEAVDNIWAELYAEGGTESPPYISKNDFLKACGLSEEDIGRG